MRDNKSNFLSETSSLIKIAFDDNDLMFKRPHLKFLFPELLQRLC